MNNFEETKSTWKGASQKSNFSKMLMLIKIRNKTVRLMKIVRTVVFILIIAVFFRISQMFSLYSAPSIIGFTLIYLDIVGYSILYWRITRKRSDMSTTSEFITGNKYLYQNLYQFYCNHAKVFGIILILAINLLFLEVFVKEILIMRLAMHFVSSILIGITILIGIRIHKRSVMENIQELEEFEKEISISEIS